jgi:hypothetical protein
MNLIVSRGSYTCDAGCERVLHSEDVAAHLFHAVAVDSLDGCGGAD